MTDKEKLTELMCQNMQRDYCEVYCENPPCDIVVEGVDNLIANNVVIQKQSEWVEFVDDDPFIGELRYPMCKRCNHIALVASRYCPDCGALMRRDGDSDV